MIEVNHLTKKFGDFYSIQNVHLQIPKGEVFGFLGPNLSANIIRTAPIIRATITVSILNNLSIKSLKVNPKIFLN